MTIKKLLRPLHRQRTRRYRRATVLNSTELCDHFAIAPEDLEILLRREGVHFHKDSQGEIWLSSFADASLTEEAE